MRHIPMIRTTHLISILVLWSLFIGLSAVASAEAPKAAQTGSMPIMEGWLNDVGEAVKQAEERDALVLVDLYAEWCGWCKVLEEKVFSTPEFKKYASEKDFVLLRVDTEDGADGSGLQTRFQAFSLPTTLIMDSKFVKVGMISGYAPAQEFMGYISQQLDAWQAIGAHYEAVLQSTDAELKRQLAEDLHQRGDGVRAAALYQSVIDQVQPGTEAHAWLHYMNADALRMARDFDNATEALDSTRKLIPKLGKKAGDLQERVDLLSFYIAQDNGDCKQALSSIQTFLTSHPDSMMRKVLEQTRRDLQKIEACT